MTRLCPPRPTQVLLATLVAGMMTFGGAHDASGQGTTRPGLSPAAPPDLSRPSFDTANPRYGGIKAGERAGEVVVAEVDGRAITLAEIGDRIRQMPKAISNLPYEILFPNMVEQIVRRTALVVRGHRRGYDDDPIVRRRMKAAAEEVLANETVLRETAETITEARMQERFRQDYAGKPGPEQAHVRVIVLPNEAEAKVIIQQLKDGADFVALAKQHSKDGSASVGGDLGFLAREGLNAEVGAVAFVLNPGQVAPYPVRSGGSWFVVKTEARRVQPTLPYAAVKESIRQALTLEAAAATIRSALDDVTVREYDMAGKELDLERSSSQ